MNIGWNLLLCLRLLTTRCIGLPWRLGPRNGRAPTHLVVLCHGAQSDSLHMQPFVRRWRERAPDAAFFLPDAHFSASRSRVRRFAARVYGRRYWFGLIDRSVTAMAAGVRPAAIALNLAIDEELARLGLPKSRVVICGYSQGGMMALYAGLRRRSVPLAIVGLSATLVDLPALPSEIRTRPPVLLVCGAEDDVVPNALWRETERALKAADVHVETNNEPGIGHHLSAAMCDACLEFVGRIVESLPGLDRSSPAAPESGLDEKAASPSTHFA